MRGAEVPKPPHDRGAACCSHRCVAAPQSFILSTTSAEMKDLGEPVSRRSTVMYRNVASGLLCTLALVVKDVSSPVMIPPVRSGPYSGRAGVKGNGQVLAEWIAAECLSRRASIQHGGCCGGLSMIS